MRILFCLDSFSLGGTELHVLKAIRALSKPGVTVAVLVASRKGPLLSEFEASAEIFQYTLTSLASWSLVSAVREILRVIHEFRPDVVHSFDMYSNVIVLPIARMAGVRCVVGSKRWLTYVPRRYHFLNSLAMRTAHAVIANSETIRKTLVSNERLGAQRTHVIRNIIAPEMFMPPAAGWVESMRTAFGVPKGVKIVGIVARLDEAKDHATFLRSIAAVRDRMSNFFAVCVGDGLERTKLESLTSELGIADIVRFVGFQPNVPNLNWLFDVAVLTSIAEGSPNAVLEAMSVGCPVVATRAGGIVDAAEAAHRADAQFVLCDVGDDKAIGNAIAYTLSLSPMNVSERLAIGLKIAAMHDSDAYMRASTTLYDNYRAKH